MSQCKREGCTAECAERPYRKTAFCAEHLATVGRSACSDCGDSLSGQPKYGGSDDQWVCRHCATEDTFG